MEFVLVLLLVLPLIGAIIGAALPDAKLARVWALVVSLLTLAVGAAAVWGFYTTPHGLPAFKSDLLAISSIGFQFHLGVDAVSLWLIALTVFLQPLAIAASFNSIRERQKEYYAWMNLLLVAMVGVFLARDLLLFYVFFELTLIPMFFIIGIWGGPERRAAAAKFFLFTFAGGVLTLAAVIYLGTRFSTFDLASLISHATDLTVTQRWWVALGLLAGFAVKVPLFPVHTWLPLAHTEAPTAGSVILAGVLLKLGTYGLLRVALPIGLLKSGLAGEFTVAFPGLIKFIGAICIVGIIYGALVAWVQKDIKKLVAYSSVSHLGFCVLGMMALNREGQIGSVLYMINHGLSTGALFLVIGMIYDRYHTRDIDQLSGLGRRMPMLSFFFVLFTLSSIGLPGLNGFVSEFLTILGAFTSPHLGMAFGIPAALGIILGAVYMLHMVARVIFGPLKTPLDGDPHHGHGPSPQPSPGVPGEGEGAQPSHSTPGDIRAGEVAILVPIALAVILLGVYPSAITSEWHKSLPKVAEPAVRAVRHASDVMLTEPSATGSILRFEILRVAGGSLRMTPGIVAESGGAL